LLDVNECCFSVLDVSRERLAGDFDPLYSLFEQFLDGPFELSGSLRLHEVFDVIDIDRIPKVLPEKFHFLV